MEFPVIVRHNELTLKLFNWMDFPRGEPARNVQAFDQNDNLIWTIEDLGGGDSDCYTQMESKDGKIHAYNFMGYDCVIDEETGKVLSKVFTK